MFETVSLFRSNAMVLEYQLPSSFLSLAVSDILKDFSKWKFSLYLHTMWRCKVQSSNDLDKPPLAAVICWSTSNHSQNNTVLVSAQALFVVYSLELRWNVSRSATLNRVTESHCARARSRFVSRGASVSWVEKSTRTVEKQNAPK